MDLTRPVTYRGLHLTGAKGGDPGEGGIPIEGLRLTRARFSDVSVHGYVEKRSLDDGFDASDVFIGMRDIQLSGEVFARDKAMLFDLLDAMRLKFTPTDAFNEDPSRQGFLPLAFSQPTRFLTYWEDGYVDRVIYARPSQTAGYDIAYQAIGGRAEDGYVVPFTLALVAKDPRFYYPVPVAEPMEGDSGEGPLQNRGNYPAPLNLILVAEDATDTHVDFLGGGAQMSLHIPASTPGGVLRVDSVKKVVTRTVGTTEVLRMDLIDFDAGTTWPKVLPTPEGDSPEGYEWSSDDALAEGSQMFFSEAWV